MDKVRRMDYKEELEKLIDEIDDSAGFETIQWCSDEELFDRLLYFHDLAMELKNKIGLEEMYE